MKTDLTRLNDNVVRMHEFRRRHPDITVEHHDEGLCWEWQATIPGRPVMVAISLGHLLDRLEDPNRWPPSA